MLENQKLESFQCDLQKLANFCKDFPTASEPEKITLLLRPGKKYKNWLFSSKFVFGILSEKNFEVNIS